MTTYASQRFTAPIHDLSAILVKCKHQKEKGMGFFRNKSRDVLFRLEGLCRIYRNIGDKKFFDSWYKEFKLLEDTMGSMDHNTSMHLEFFGYKEFKTASLKIFDARFKEEAIYVSDLLRNDGWLNGEKMKEFSDGLAKLDWKEDDDDVVSYGTVFCDALDKVVNKYRNGELDPSRPEEGVHEFRRRLRWVSIYAQVANGMIGLRQVTKVSDDLKKYCTPEIVNSRFNVFEKPANGQRTIIIQSHYFYALSWLIRELSELKDAALRSQAFNEMMVTSSIKDPKLYKKFLATCRYDPNEVASIVEIIIDDFIYKDFIPERICRDVLRSKS